MFRTRVFRRLQSTITYSRKGEQVEVAPKPVKQVSKLSNGVTIASIDAHGPQASLAVYLNAGSRHELDATPGVAHLFKRSVVRVFRFFKSRPSKGTILHVRLWIPNSGEIHYIRKLAESM
jgi:hypothetical protein